MIRWLVLICLALAPAPSAAIAAEPQPFVQGSFAALRAAHAGRPWIVHLWGLSCGPCLIELPQWGQLAKDNAGAAIVLINADRPDPRANPRITGVLERAGLAGVPSYVFADRFEDRLRFELDAEWQGELPRTLLIGAGGVVSAMTGTADMAAIREWIGRQGK